VSIGIDIAYVLGLQAGSRGDDCPHPSSLAYKFGWLVGKQRYLTSQLTAARARVREVEETTVQRIIEACNAVRAEYHAKMAKQHEEHMVYLGELRNESDRRVRAAIVENNEEWRSTLRGKGWGSAVKPDPTPDPNPISIRSIIESVLVTVGLARHDDALDQLNSDHFPQDGGVA
jgi:hypothetical protein